MNKVSRNTARKMFYMGNKVYLLPNKVRLDNMWLKPYEISCHNERTFDGLVNSYHYYNCNTELGNNVSFYV